ncbi:MAG: hypothetical protein EA394_06270 [Bacteroidia bacterium]|nr:MAG: hypothetical protein EA394_06270 [Bacteroidia bacterium]
MRFPERKIKQRKFIERYRCSKILCSPGFISYICGANKTDMKARNIIAGLFLSIFLFIGSSLLAQDGAESLLYERDGLFDPTPRMSMQLGSSFSTGWWGGNMFVHSLAPRMNWDMSQNFHLEVGTIFSSARMNTMEGMFLFGPHFTDGGSMPGSQPGTLFSSTVYAAGAYRVNPRLSLIGATWLERIDHDYRGGTPLNPYAMQQNPKGMMLGFDYRVSENFRFGAEVSFSTGYHPFSNMQMQRHPFGGLYNPMPFHRQNRW